MRLLLLTIVLAGALAAPNKKREVLPGDPRYGTDYRSNSYKQNEITSYGPPNHVPGKPIGGEYNIHTEQVASVEPTYAPVVKNVEINTASERTSSFETPVDSYGSPVPSFTTPVDVQVNNEDQQNEQTVVSSSAVTKVAGEGQSYATKQYLSPVIRSQQESQQQLPISQVQTSANSHAASSQPSFEKSSDAGTRGFVENVQQSFSNALQQVQNFKPGTAFQDTLSSIQAGTFNPGAALQDTFSNIQSTFGFGSGASEPTVSGESGVDAEAALRSFNVQQQQQSYPLLETQQLQLPLQQYGVQSFQPQTRVSVQQTPVIQQVPVVQQQYETPVYQQFPYAQPHEQYGVPAFQQVQRVAEIPQQQHYAAPVQFQVKQSFPQISQLVEQVPQFPQVQFPQVQVPQIPQIPHIPQIPQIPQVSQEQQQEQTLVDINKSTESFPQQKVDENGGYIY